MRVYGLDASYRNAKKHNRNLFVSIARTHSIDALRTLRQVESLVRSASEVNGALIVEKDGAARVTFDVSHETLELWELLLLSDALLIDLDGYCARAVKRWGIVSFEQAKFEFEELQSYVQPLAHLVPFRLAKTEQTSLRGKFRDCQELLGPKFDWSTHANDLFSVEIKDFFERSDYWDQDFASSDRGSLKRALYYLLLAKCSGVPVIFGVDHYEKIWAAVEHRASPALKGGVQALRQAAESTGEGSWLTSLVFKALARRAVEIDPSVAKLPAGTRKTVCIAWREAVTEVKNSPDVKNLRVRLAQAVGNVSGAMAAHEFQKASFVASRASDPSEKIATGVALQIGAAGPRISAPIDPLMTWWFGRKQRHRVERVAIAYSRLSRSAETGASVRVPVARMTGGG